MKTCLAVLKTIQIIYRLSPIYDETKKDTFFETIYSLLHQENTDVPAKTKTKNKNRKKETQQSYHTR